MAQPAAPPGLAQDWEATWCEGVTPGTRWDIAGSYRPLQALVASGRVPDGRALIPGCGRGWDVLTLAAANRHAMGLEIAPTAAQTARNLIASAPVDKRNASVVIGDFFTLRDKFDVIFDYTMLCATLPARRGEWAAQMRELLVPGGMLICGAFPLKPWPAGSPEDPSRGPPFQLSKQLYHDLLEPLGFVCEEERDLVEDECFPIRLGYEAVSVWRAPS